MKLPLSSARRRSSALKLDILLPYFALLPVGSVSVTTSGARFFVTVSANVRGGFGLDFVKFIVLRALHTRLNKNCYSFLRSTWDLTVL